MALLTQERLKTLLSYEPGSGVFVWQVNRPNGVKIGDVAGSLNRATGYWQIKVNGQTYTAARLAWLYMHGDLPKHIVDHADLNKTNNSWNNLREATHAQNIQNRAAHKGSKSGLKGVHFAPTRTSFKKWAAHIRIGGVLKTLGYFEHPEEAHAVYSKAAQAAFGQFARS